MVISHWCKLIEGLQTSPLDFYKCIEDAIDRRRIPGLKRSHVLWPEGGLLSAKRDYLRLTREGLLFDICVAPFGTGTFVSCRLVQREIPWLLIAITVFFTGLVLLCLLIFVGMRTARSGPNALQILTAGAFVLAFYVMFACLVVGTLLIISRFILVADAWLMRMPLLYKFYERITRRNTYYRIDLILMFQSAVQAAVMEVVDKHIETQNLKPLSEWERKPTLSKLLMR